MSTRLTAFFAPYCIAVLLLAATALTARTEETPLLLADPYTEMEELDQSVLQKQRELFAARIREDGEAVTRLTAEFDAIQERRREIIEDNGHLF